MLLRYAASYKTHLLTHLFLQPVHVDLLLGLEKNMTHFFHQLTTPSSDPSQDGVALHEFQVDEAIPSSALCELVYFAYHRRCKAMTEHTVMTMAAIGAHYRINSLVQHCLAFLLEHCSLSNVIKAYQLASDEQFANKSMASVFQTYIEDNFEQVS